MVEPTIVVVSDLHISNGSGIAESVDSGQHPWSWCSRVARDQFVDWCEALLKRPEVEQVVLNGDIVDSWIWPYDVTPPTVDNIYASVFFVPVLQVLQQLSQQKHLLYLAGNHDMLATHSNFLCSALPRADTNVACDVDAVHVEHGNHYCCFTCFDDRMPTGTPVGYYISRLCAAVDRDTGSHVMGSREYTAAILEMAGHGNVADAILTAMQRKGNIPSNAGIQLLDGDTTLNTVAQQYDDTLLWFAGLRGLDGLLAGIDGETKSLEPAADILLAKTPGKIVVLGHTHEPVLQTRKNGTYANSGCWGATPENQTWVEVTGTTVTLHDNAGHTTP